MITHDPLALVFRPGGDLGGGAHVGAAGDAGDDALFLGQAARPLKGFFVGDLDHLVDERRVEVLGDEAGADALNLVRPGLAAGDDRRVGRLDGDRLEVRVLRLDDSAPRR